MPNERPTLVDLRVKFEKLDTDLDESNEDHPLRRRLRRSLSWLERADSGKLDDDVRYIFLWVAFNAAYADARNLRSLDEPPGEAGVERGVKHADARNPRSLDERGRYTRYFKKLTEEENDKNRIYNILKCKLMNVSRSLVENKYVFQGFWDFLDDGWFNEDKWKKSIYGGRFEDDRKKVRKLLGLGDQLGSMQAALQEVDIASREATIRTLEILFKRLYVLRNQIMHGSATSHTWTDPKRPEPRKRSTSAEDGSLNRRQVEDGIRILDFLVPLFLDIMMERPELDDEKYWGKLPYPIRYPRGQAQHTTITYRLV